MKFITEEKYIQLINEVKTNCDLYPKHCEKCYDCNHEWLNYEWNNKLEMYERTN